MGCNPHIQQGIDTPTGRHDDPQIVILGVAGSSPVSHPFGLFSACNADIWRGESNASYHSDESYRNCSRAKTLLDSPALYSGRYVTRSIPSFSSAATDHGSLLHEWLEKGDAVLDSFAVPPEDTLTPTGLPGKESKKWIADHFGRDATVVAPKEMAQLRAEIAAIKANPAAVELLDTVVGREISVRWTDSNGHRLRCRFDCVTSNGLVLDLKTTRESDILADWWKAVLTFKYHLQDAWYRRGMEACGMEPAPLRFIVVSTALPHDCQVVTLPAPLVAEGERLMDKALNELRLREDLDWWMPDRHGEVTELQFPAHILGRMQ